MKSLLGNLAILVLFVLTLSPRQQRGFLAAMDDIEVQP
jgi:hypothetical protein